MLPIPRDYHNHNRKHSGGNYGNRDHHGSNSGNYRSYNRNYNRNQSRNYHESYNERSRESEKDRETQAALKAIQKLIHPEKKQLFLTQAETDSLLKEFSVDAIGNAINVLANEHVISFPFKRLTMESDQHVKMFSLLRAHDYQVTKSIKLDDFFSPYARDTYPFIFYPCGSPLSIISPDDDYAKIDVIIDYFQVSSFSFKENCTILSLLSFSLFLFFSDSLFCNLFYFSSRSVVV
jgi:hypothetical protein